MKTDLTSYIPPQKALKKMGLISDQEGIMKRYMAEQGGWNNHLKNTKDFIVKCLNQEKSKKIAILGSGWLLDIPVSFLTERSDDICFYDLYHPKVIIHKYRKQSNFRFSQIDLTGGLIEQVYNILQRKKRPDPSELLNQLNFEPCKLPFKADYLVSINILSQIDTLLLDYIKNKMPLPSEIENLFRQKIQQQHIDLLKSNRSCLISDVEEIKLDQNHEIIATKPLIFVTIPDSQVQKEWVWNFDTRMTYHPDCKTIFLVKAFKLS